MCGVRVRELANCVSVEHQTTDQWVFLFIQISTIDSPGSLVGKQTMPRRCNKAFLSNCLLHQLSRPYWGMTLASCNTHKALNWSPLATSVTLSGPEDTQVSRDISFCFFWTSSSLLKRVIHIQPTAVQSALWNKKQNKTKQIKKQGPPPLPRKSLGLELAGKKPLWKRDSCKSKRFIWIKKSSQMKNREEEECGEKTRKRW